jgi:MFS family permease
MTTQSGGRIFYGWYVIVAIGVTLTVGSGLTFYNLSVLLDAFVRERGFPVSVVSGAIACFFVATGVSGVWAGILINRIDARLLIIASATAGALALASVAYLTEPWQLYVFHLVLGLCYGGCGLVPTTTIVARWFTVRRPLAMAIASLGLSLGGIVLTPFSALMIWHWGLAGAAPWIALMFLIGVVPLNALVVRAWPRDMGLQPDGAATPLPGSRTPEGSGVLFAEARRSRFFFAVAVAYMFASGAQVGAIMHLYRLAVDRAGLDVAALAVAVVAGASVAGRLMGGWMMQTVKVRTFAPVIMGVQSVALNFLAVAPSSTTFIVSAALFGLSIGNVLILQSLLLADAFGARDYGRIYSMNQLISMVGVASGPALMGIIYDASGGYALPYIAAAVASMVGGLIVLFGGRSRR